MALKFTTFYLEDSLSVFRYYKRLAEAAMVQVTDEQLFTVLDPEMNSIALMVKHMAGNIGLAGRIFSPATGRSLTATAITNLWSRHRVAKNCCSSGSPAGSAFSLRLSPSPRKT